MTKQTAQPYPNNFNQREVYIYGDDSVFTQKLHAVRTANQQASWFLPYLQPGMSLLDCGCATGSITIGFADLVAPGQVTDIDISATGIERARARAVKAGATNLRFEVGNLYQIGYPDNHFDALFCHNVLEHIGEPARALREMYRVLKVGGIIGVRDLDMGGILLAPDDALLERFFAVFEAAWAGVGGHPRIGQQLPGLLAEAGFVDVAASACYEAFHDSERRRLASQIGASYVKEDAFVERVLGRGLATVGDLDAMHAAWLAWQRNRRRLELASLRRRSCGRGVVW